MSQAPQPRKDKHRQHRHVLVTEVSRPHNNRMSRTQTRLIGSHVHSYGYQFEAYEGQLPLKSHDILMCKRRCLAAPVGRSPPPRSSLLECTPAEQLPSLDDDTVEWFAQIGTQVVFDVGNEAPSAHIWELEERLNARSGNRLKSTFAATNFCLDVNGGLDKWNVYADALARCLKKHLSQLGISGPVTRFSYILTVKYDSCDAEAKIPCLLDNDGFQLNDRAYPLFKNILKENWVLLPDDGDSLGVRFQAFASRISCGEVTVVNGVLCALDDCEASYTRKERTFELSWIGPHSRQELIISVRMLFDEGTPKNTHNPVPIRIVVEVKLPAGSYHQGDVEWKSFAMDVKVVASIVEKNKHDALPIVRFDHRLQYCLNEKKHGSCLFTTCRYHHRFTMCIHDIIGSEKCPGCNYVHGYTQLCASLATRELSNRPDLFALPNRLLDFTTTIVSGVRHAYEDYLNWIFAELCKGMSPDDQAQRVQRFDFINALQTLSTFCRSFLHDCDPEEITQRCSALLRAKRHVAAKHCDPQVCQSGHLSVGQIVVKLSLELCSTDPNSEGRVRPARQAVCNVATAVSKLVSHFLEDGDQEGSVTVYDHDLSQLKFFARLTGTTAANLRDFLKTVVYTEDKFQRFSCEFLPANVRAPISVSTYQPSPAQVRAAAALFKAILQADPSSRYHFSASAEHPPHTNALYPYQDAFYKLVEGLNLPRNETILKLREAGCLTNTNINTLMVKWYTSDAFYAELNQRLRKPLDDATFDLLRPFMGLLLHGIRLLTHRAPRSGCTLYRGMTFETEDQRRQYAPGASVMWSNVSSCSCSEAVAKNFINGKEGGVLLEIEAKIYSDIRACSVFPKEDERILPPYTRLLVVDEKPDRICLRQVVYSSTM